MPKTEETAEDRAERALERVERKIGVVYSHSEHDPTKDMYVIWDCVPCHVRKVRFDGEDLLLFSKRPLTREQIALWKAASKAVMQAIDNDPAVLASIDPKDRVSAKHV